jgi:hypothetical protein
MSEGGRQYMSELLKKAINECAAEAIDSFNWRQTAASTSELANDATEEIVIKVLNSDKGLPNLSKLNSELNRLMENVDLIKEEIKDEILDEVDEMLKEFKVELLMEMEARTSAPPATVNKPKLACASSEVIGAGNILDFTMDIRSALEFSHIDKERSDDDSNDSNDNNDSDDDYSDNNHNEYNENSDTEYDKYNDNINDNDSTQYEVPSLMNNKIFNLVSSGLNKSSEIDDPDSEDEKWEQLVKLKYNL